MRDYILVTPIRNEAENLLHLFESILSQNHKPSYWLMMNDNSVDKSKSIIEEFVEVYDFIHLIDLEKAEKDLAWRYHKIMSQGFSYAIDYCNSNGISWSYIGVLDGDIFYSDINYYSNLISEFRKDNGLGIASGQIYSKKDGYFSLDRNKYGFPRGANRLISRECYSRIGGYPIEPCADSVMRIKSESKGFTCKVFDDLIAYQSRETTGTSNTFKTGKYLANVKYYLHFPILYFIVKLFYFLLKLKLKLASGFFIAAFNAFISNEERTSDIDVIQYYHLKYKNPLKRIIR